MSYESFVIPKPYAIYLGSETDPLAAKVAVGVCRWRPDDCVAQIRDLGCGIDLGLPDQSLEQARECGAKTLVIGASPRGGRLNGDWKKAIIRALQAGLDVASGLHDQLNDDPELCEAAEQTGRRLIDVRSCPEGLRPGSGKKMPGTRVATVGTDCSVGKMHTSLHLVQGLVDAGRQARFFATGQTGIMIEGSGVCVDAVVSDFISGATERLTVDLQADEIGVIEGQGSLFHPSFAGVSLGLLHGSQPDWIVVCHEVTRPHMRGLPDFALPGLRECIELNLQHARLTNPQVKCLGISLNTTKVSSECAQQMITQVETELGLAATDPERFGVEKFIRVFSDAEQPRQACR